MKTVDEIHPFPYLLINLPEGSLYHENIYNLLPERGMIVY